MYCTVRSSERARMDAEGGTRTDMLLVFARLVLSGLYFVVVGITREERS